MGTFEILALVALSFLVISGIFIFFHRARGRQRDIERAESKRGRSDSSDNTGS